jgi:hypothetical protein
MGYRKGINTMAARGSSFLHGRQIRAEGKEKRPSRGV